MISIRFATDFGWPRSVQVWDEARCLDLLADFIAALNIRTHVTLSVGAKGRVEAMWSALVTRELRLAAMDYVVRRESAREAA